MLIAKGKIKLRKKLKGKTKGKTDPSIGKRERCSLGEVGRKKDEYYLNRREEQQDELDDDKNNRRSLCEGSDAASRKRAPKKCQKPRGKYATHAEFIAEKDDQKLTD
jgi:hypothetical protein